MKSALLPMEERKNEEAKFAWEKVFRNQYMLKDGDFDRIIGYGIGDVKERFERYLEASL